MGYRRDDGSPHEIRYLISDLPSASYSVWVRGYGLVDSPKMTAKPGATLNHTATIAPNEAAAAHYYPAAYWYAMLKIPPAKDFGGSTDIPKNITQDNWLRQMTTSIASAVISLARSRPAPSRLRSANSNRVPRPGNAAFSPDKPASP